jgi:hypothetical protein
VFCPNNKIKNSLFFFSTIQTFNYFFKYIISTKKKRISLFNKISMANRYFEEKTQAHDLQLENII